MPTPNERDRWSESLLQRRERRRERFERKRRPKYEIWCCGRKQYVTLKPHALELRCKICREVVMDIRREVNGDE